MDMMKKTRTRVAMLAVRHWLPWHARSFRLRCLTALCVVGLAAGRLVGETEDPLRMLPPPDTNATDEVGVEEVLGDLPLAEEEGPIWMPATAWISSPAWDVGLELGMNGSEGNAQSFSLVSSASAKRKTEGNTLDLGLTYGKTQANGVESQNYGIFNSRWDWNFTPTWFLYNKNIVEYDEFKAFDLRLVLSAGLGYHFIRSDTTTLSGRAGAGVSREFGRPDDDWLPEANLGLDFEHQLTAKQKVKISSDYYPAWEDFLDYRLLFNANWEILLDEATNLSLKIGMIDRYDSTPNGRQANDLDYFTTLVWKL